MQPLVLLISIKRLFHHFGYRVTGFYNVGTGSGQGDFILTFHTLNTHNQYTGHIVNSDCSRFFKNNMQIVVYENLVIANLYTFYTTLAIYINQI